MIHGFIALLLNLAILIILLGIVYLILDAIVKKLGVAWGGLAMQIVGLLCLLLIVLWFLAALTGGPLLYSGDTWRGLCGK